MKDLDPQPGTASGASRKEPFTMYRTERRGPDCPDGQQDARIWLGADDPMELARAALAGLSSPRPQGEKDLEPPRKAGPSGLVWSREKPRREGFYWLRHDLGEASIIEIAEIAGVWYLFDTEHSEQHLRKFNEEYEWAGPIPEPETGPPVPEASQPEGSTSPVTPQPPRAIHGGADNEG